jgi:hypothetical protein
MGGAEPMPMQRFLRLGFLITLFFAFWFSPQRGSSPEPAHRYQTEQEAQQHCPNDTVVWLNPRTGVYHFRGHLWYGNTRDGCYECPKEADREGDRATRNGQ